MSKIEDTYPRYVADSRINERLGMLEELLGVVSDPADDTLSTSGMPCEISDVENCVPSVDAPAYGAR